MMIRNIKDKKWYPMAVALCIAIAFYFLLSHIATIWGIIKSIGYFVYPVIAGIIVAYLINPLMRLFEEKVFRKIKKAKVKRTLSLSVSMVIVLAFIGLIIGTLVPQLYGSVVNLYSNRENYLRTLKEWLNSLGAGNSNLKEYVDNLFSSSNSWLEMAVDFLSQNGGNIGAKITKVGGHVGTWVIGFIFSLYFLAEKEKMGEIATDILKHIQRDEEKTERTLKHLRKIDTILTRYIIFSIIDGLIIGVINYFLMLIFGMQYRGLVSVIVGVTNLVPTFGPLIGAAIGGFILLLVNPRHALYFLIFTVVLQTIDGYILKPKMFGETFGVSGLWILVAIIVGNRVLGVLGIVLAIPFVAIVDYLIKELYLPYRKKQDEKLRAEKESVSNENK